MSATARTTLIYPLTDFTTSGGVVNSVSLKQELTDASLSIPVSGASLDSSYCTITLSGNATSDDITKCNTVVAAHTGAAFSSTTQRVSDENEAETVLTDWQTHLTLTSGPLPAGYYSLVWYAEIYLDSVVAGDSVDVHALVGSTERGFQSSSSNLVDSFSGVY